MLLDKIKNQNFLVGRKSGVAGSQLVRDRKQDFYASFIGQNETKPVSTNLHRAQTRITMLLETPS